MDRNEERMVTTDQMIEWAIEEGKRAEWVADAMRHKEMPGSADKWEENARIAYATADRLRLVRSMVETLRPE